MDLLFASQLVGEGSLYICHLPKRIMCFIIGISYSYCRQQALQLGQETEIGLILAAGVLCGPGKFA